MRPLTGLLIAVSALWATIGAAAADPLESGFLGGQVDADAGGGETPWYVLAVAGSLGPWTDSTSDPCRYEVLGFADAYAAARLEIGFVDADQQLLSSPLDAPELWERPWLLVYCPTSASGEVLTAFVQLTAGPPATETMESLVRGLLEIEIPAPVLSPAADSYQIAGVETWIWVPDHYAAPVTVSGCAGPDDYACASMTATFSHLEIDSGDGSEPFACRGLTAWKSSTDRAPADHCRHVYTSASTSTGVTMTVTASWALWWSCHWDEDLDGFREAPCGGGPLEPARLTAPPIEMEVRQIQARAVIE